MKLHRVPYTNQLARHQTPKADRRERNRGGTTCYSCDPKYDYTPFDGGRECKEFGGGESDKRKAWRCPDCGRPCDTVDQAACPRCGSTESCEWR
jgi:hypothetical protein